MTTRQDLPRLFSHHPPKGPEQAEVYDILRGAGRAFAEQVLALVPKGVEREEAIRNIRAAVMWANSGIACAPEPGEQHPVPLIEVLADHEDDRPC